MTKFIRIVFSVFMLAFLSACGGGGGSAGNTSGVALFTTAATNIVVSPGETQTYSIGGGIPAYTATSNSGAASASVNGKTLTITGGGGGTATITIKDAAGVAIKIDVVVGSGLALFSTAPSSVTVSVGATSSVYTVGGGSQVYAITSSNQQIAGIGRSGSNQFVINGFAGGKADVAVKDSLGASVTIAVIVGSSDAMFTTAPTALNMAVGAANTYKIGGGIAPYAAGSSDLKVATVAIVGTDLTISATGTGTATIIVHDAAAGSVSISVTVGAGAVSPLFTTAASDITIAPSTSPNFTVGGGKAPYSVSTNNASVVTGSISGTTLTVAGIATGTAKLQITDAAGTALGINVTVGSGGTVPLFTTAPSSITMVSGVTVPYTIVGGTSPYTVTSSNIGVSTVSGVGAAYTITGVSTGVSQVVVRDAVGASIIIAVNVTAVASIVLDVLPNAATGSVGDTLTFSIVGGSANFSINNNNPSIATVSPTTLGAGGKFTATLLNVGNTLITVVDAQGISKQVTVTALQGTPTLRLSPSALTVGENTLGNIDLSIFGGTGPYRAFTSSLVFSSVPTGLITATPPATTLVTTLGTGFVNGVLNRCFTPVVNDGTYAVTFTVVDSLGATATSVMTIQDNGRGNQVLPLLPVATGCP